MKIASVSHWTEHFKLTKPYTIASGTFDAVDNHFVHIQTEDGTFGLGAASPGDDITGETIDDCAAALKAHLEALLLHQDIRYLKGLLEKLHQTMPAAPAARAAVEMALHDLAAKKIGLPLADLFGRFHQALPTSITIGIDSVEATIEEAVEYVGRGFRHLKVKIGRSLEEDLERLYRLRERFGKQIGIRVDANQGYSPQEFMGFVHKAESLGLELIEQPLSAGEIETMQALSEPVRKIAAADESLLNPYQALAYTHPPRPFGIYNIKLMKCGGIQPALQIAEIAKLAGIDLMWGCMDESIVSIAAALHTAFASPATRYLDLDGSFSLARDLVTGGFILNEGTLSTTAYPGLGVILKHKI
jgi:L-alanine-DL-glutamate epimerase-like enolase superfamily enzyme